MNEIIQWLMEGDVSIQYQVSRDLLKTSSDHLCLLQNKIASEGWGARFLEKRKCLREFELLLRSNFISLSPGGLVYVFTLSPKISEILFSQCNTLQNPRIKLKLVNPQTEPKRMPKSRKT